MPSPRTNNLGISFAFEIIARILTHHGKQAMKPFFFIACQARLHQIPSLGLGQIFLWIREIIDVCEKRQFNEN